VKQEMILSLKKLKAFMVTDDAGDFILAGNADLMEMVGRKSFQYAPLCLENLQPSQSQDNQEHKILLLLQ
jgi:hypothetical protein